MSERCHQCGRGLRYLLSRNGDRVLCWSCSSGNAMERHHIAGRKIAPNWIVFISINLHRMVTRRMARWPRIPDLPPGDTPLKCLAQLIWSVIGIIELVSATMILAEDTCVSIEARNAEIIKALKETMS